MHAAGHRGGCSLARFRSREPPRLPPAAPHSTATQAATCRLSATFAWHPASAWASARTLAASPGERWGWGWAHALRGGWRRRCRTTTICVCSNGRRLPASRPGRHRSFGAPLHIHPRPSTRRSWANLWNADALVKLVPTLASCAAMIATLEHFSHPLALPGGARLAPAGGWRTVLMLGRRSSCASLRARASAPCPISVLLSLLHYHSVLPPSNHPCCSARRHKRGLPRHPPGAGGLAGAGHGCGLGHQACGACTWQSAARGRDACAGQRLGGCHGGGAPTVGAPAAPLCITPLVDGAAPPALLIPLPVLGTAGWQPEVLGAVGPLQHPGLVPQVRARLTAPRCSLLPAGRGRVGWGGGPPRRPLAPRAQAHPVDPRSSLSPSLSLLPCSGIYFPAMGEQVVKVLGLALVVIFGSAMVSKQQRRRWSSGRSREAHGQQGCRRMEAGGQTVEGRRGVPGSTGCRRRALLLTLSCSVPWRSSLCRT